MAVKKEEERSPLYEEIGFEDSLEPEYGEKAVRIGDEVYSSEKEKNLANANAKKAMEGLLPVLVASFLVGVAFAYFTEMLGTAVVVGAVAFNFILGTMQYWGDYNTKKKCLLLHSEVVSKVKHDGWQELTIEFIYNGQYHQCKLMDDEGIRVGSKPNIYYNPKTDRITLERSVKSKSGKTLYYIGGVMALLTIPLYFLEKYMG